METIHTRHAVWEKVLFRSGIFGAYLVGILGAALETPWVGAAYAVAAVALLRVVFTRFCSHCPYPCKHGDCLMAPFSLVKRITGERTGPMKPWERWTFPVVMIGLIPLFPQPWLWKRPALLILFWVLLLGTALMFRFHMCNACLFSDCPLNVTGNHRKWLGVL